MNALVKAIFVSTMLAAPMAHAVAPMGFGPCTVDVLINRPSANAAIHP